MQGNKSLTAFYIFFQGSFLSRSDFVMVGINHDAIIHIQVFLIQVIGIRSISQVYTLVEKRSGQIRHEFLRVMVFAVMTQEEDFGSSGPIMKGIEVAF
jgi:hypothetical protein